MAWRVLSLAAALLALAASGAAGFRAGAPFARAPRACARVHRCAARACAPPSARVDEWMTSTGRAETAVAMSGATTFTTVLSDFWAQVCTTADCPFSERALVFPLLAADAPTFSRLMAHINSCSEVCDVLGSQVFVAFRHPAGVTGEEPPAPFPMLLLKTLAGAGDGPSDEYDPFWDDDDWPESPEPHDAAVAAAATAAAGPQPDAVVLADTRKWVEAVICHMGVCPFAHSADRAGLPQGGVSYPLTRASSADEVYLEFWHQVGRLDEVRAAWPRAGCRRARACAPRGA